MAAPEAHQPSARAGQRMVGSLGWSAWPIKDASEGAAPKPVVANVMAAFDHAPELAGLIGPGPVVTRRPPWEPGEGEWTEREWTHRDTNRLTELLQHSGLLVRRQTVEDVVRDIGSPESVANPERWAEPFAWRDPSEIPPRRWLYKPHLIRGYSSLTVSPGGVGKTTLGLCEALALATGRPLLGVKPVERTKVWFWNGEDPIEELERRVHAIAMHFGIGRAEIEGWLFLGSGRKGDLVIAEQSGDGVTVFAPVVSALCRFIRANEIGAVYIDPFVSSHRVNENDNTAVDRVAKTWGRVADVTGCAIDLVHHMRKVGAGEVTVDDARGAVALVAAARDARLLRPMVEQEAEALGVETSDRLSYVRIDSGKSNMTPRSASKANWFRLANVRLPNGDEVQAAALWTPPDLQEKVTPADLLRVQQRVAAGRGDDGEGWRSSPQTGEAWVGHAIANALGLDVESPRDKMNIRKLLKAWLKSGALVEVSRPDAKRTQRPFVEVGERAEL